ncbi:MAG: threonylcarbamoyl-AMP synthase [Oscillospiraceae bacterium]|jgi:L-threonylcarbamoyladenylate synthase|nr:threonylcarbamoyl-AMP synthase [Oscillospiraceae bacterium]
MSKSLFVTLSQAVKLLQEGELVLIPTETVYGVAALASNEHAIAKLYSSKARPGLKPISWLVPSSYNIVRFCPGAPEIVLAAAEKLHITVIVNVNGNDGEVTRTQGFRIPDHPVALELLRAVNKPIAVSSANIAGFEPAKTAADALMAFGGEIPVLDGGTSHIGLSSTVVDFTSGTPVVLREGRVTLDEILALYPDENPQPETGEAEEISAESKESETAETPDSELTDIAEDSDPESEPEDEITHWLNLAIAAAKRDERVRLRDKLQSSGLLSPVIAQIFEGE